MAAESDLGAGEAVKEHGSICPGFHIIHMFNFLWRCFILTHSLCLNGVFYSSLHWVFNYFVHFFNLLFYERPIISQDSAPVTGSLTLASPPWRIWPKLRDPFLRKVYIQT